MKVIEVDLPKEREFTLTLPVCQFLGVYVPEFAPGHCLECDSDNLRVVLEVAVSPGTEKTKHRFVCLKTGRSSKDASVFMKYIGSFTSPLSGDRFHLFLKSE